MQTRALIMYVQKVILTFWYVVIMTRLKPNFGLYIRLWPLIVLVLQTDRQAETFWDEIGSFLSVCTSGAKVVQRRTGRYLTSVIRLVICFCPLYGNVIIADDDTC